MKKKIIFLLSILSMSWFFGHAQKEGNIWCFPDQLGIDFNDTSNILTFTSSVGIHGNLNQSTIADNNGNLFCYASGKDFSIHGLYVYDKNHNVMPNGGLLQGHPNFASILLNYSGIDSMVCLLHISIDPSISNFYRLFYSVINKNLNSGLGDLVIRDSLLYDARISSEKLAVVKHGNGRDWWVFIYDRDSGYVSYLLSPMGISQVNIQHIGSNGDSLYYGKLIFSNDGSKMMTVGAFGTVDVFDFDRCTGLLSNWRDIGEHLTSEPYQYLSAAFSPNGNLIYVSPFNLTKNFYQFDLNASNITASKVLLNSYPDTGLTQWNTYNWHNLAPDGKIYIPIVSNYQGPNIDNVTTQHLDVIEYPDSVGTACHYIRQAFSLGSHHAAACLPNMPYYGLGAMTGSACDSLTGIKNVTEINNAVEVFPNPSSGVFSLKLKDVNDKIISTEVEDILGNRVLFTKYFSSIFDLSAYSDGIYVLRVQTQKKKTFAAKVVKQ